MRAFATIAFLFIAGCAGSDVATAPAPVLDGFSYAPMRAIESNESYTFTLKSHNSAQAPEHVDWQPTGGWLPNGQGETVTWQAVKPGGQLKPGRVRVEVRVVTVGGPSDSHVGGTVYLTIGDDGRASVDGFAANSFGALAGTPAPTLSTPTPASPLPGSDSSLPAAPLDQGATDAAATDAAASPS